MGDIERTIATLRGAIRGAISLSTVTLNAGVLLSSACGTSPRSAPAPVEEGRTGSGTSGVQEATNTFSSNNSSGPSESSTSGETGNDSADPEIRWDVRAEEGQIDEDGPSPYQCSSVDESGNPFVFPKHCADSVDEPTEAENGHIVLCFDTEAGECPVDCSDGLSGDLETVERCGGLLDDKLKEEFEGLLVAELLCQPEPPYEGSCCFVICGEFDHGGFDGRPFLVDQESRTAPIAASKDWLLPIKPSLEGLPEGLRKRLAKLWLQRAQAEHASIASFSRFVLQLLALEAPPALITDAQRALADEVEHARVAFSLASAYGGQSYGPQRLAIQNSLGDDDIESIIRAAIHEGCIGETMAAAAANLAAARTKDPLVRDALSRIATDESRHAALAWRFLAWILRKDPTYNELVSKSFEAFRPTGEKTSFDNKEHQNASVEDLESFGYLSQSSMLQLHHQLWNEVLDPAIAQLGVAHRPEFFSTLCIQKDLCSDCHVLGSTREARALSRTRTGQWAGFLTWKTAAKSHKPAPVCTIASVKRDKALEKRMAGFRKRALFWRDSILLKLQNFFS